MTQYHHTTGTSPARTRVALHQPTPKETITQLRAMTSRALAGVLLALASLLTLTCAQAQASQSPLASPLVKPLVFVEPPTSFGSEGSGPGQFGGGEDPGGIGVEQSTGDVLVLDNNDHRVEVFALNSKGEYEFASEFNGAQTPTGAIDEESYLAVDDSTSSLDPSKGDVYIASRYAGGAVYKFRMKPGKPDEYEYVPGGDLNTSEHLEQPRGLAVNAEGDVYVTGTARFGGGAVTKFGPAGEQLGAAEMSMTYPYGQAATAPNGDLYISGYFNFSEVGTVKLAFSPSLEVEVESESVLALNSDFAVAVDPAGDVYEAGENHVVEYNTIGEPIETFGAGQVPAAGVLAFGPSSSPGISGYLYVTDEQHHDVHVFAREAPAHPKPEVTGCSQVFPTPVKAVVRCAVDPNAAAASVDVEYGELGSATLTTTPTVEVKAGGPVEVALEGLVPQKRYRYRMVATSTEGTTKGEEEVFKTPVAVKGAIGCAAPNAAIENEAATLHGGTVEPVGVSTGWSFQYGESTAYGSETKEETSESNGPVAPEAKIAGLKPHTTYHCRLVAHNKYGTTTSADGEFTTTGPPVIEGPESFQKVGSVDAEVTGGFDPVGFVGKFTASAYYVEYGTSAAYGLKTPETSVAAEKGSVALHTLLSGLQPETEYHFRIVAIDQYGTTKWPDRTFSTFAAIGSGLPDGRIYEMVSPPEFNNADVYVEENQSVTGSFFPPCCGETGTGLPFRASPDGGAVTYLADPSYEGNGSISQEEGNQYLAKRAAGGWMTENVTPATKTAAYLGFSPDLTTTFLTSGGREFSGKDAEPLTPEAPPDVPVLYARTANGYVPLAPEASYQGSSTNGRDVLLSDSNGLYEWVEGQLEQVNLLPEGTPAPQAVFGMLGPTSVGRTSLGADLSNVMSADGTRVFWTDTETHQLFVRENGTSTVQVDASKAPEGEGEKEKQEREARSGGGTFWTASGDGSKVFFTDTNDLTEDAVPGSGANLYEYDVASGELADLTPVANASVEYAFNGSENGEYVYFEATGDLAEGATLGALNVYVYHDRETKFIATLSQSDAGKIGGNPNEDQDGDLMADLGFRTAEVAPDGRAFTFESVNKLTGYDNEGVEEVYLYEAGSNQIFCASCEPTGEPPGKTRMQGNNANTVLSGTSFLPPSGAHNNTYLPRWLSEDGTRVFFDSEAPLAAHDTNGEMDVYEWERYGAGSCGNPRGCIYLISGGTSPQASYFIEASQSGGDVFFVTRERLVQQDDNEAMNLFDAHEGGVLPPSEGECSGTGCQGVPLAPTAFEAPASVTFGGIGNFSSPSGPSSQPPPSGKAKKKRHVPKKKRHVHRRRRVAAGRPGRRQKARGGAGRALRHRAAVRS